MVSFQDLDLGYEQCREIYSLIKNEGANLLSNIKYACDGLRIHWKGTDATLHINQLVSVYDGVDTFVTETGNDMSFATEKIIEVQEVRRANGASGRVGDPLSKVERSETPAKVDDTSEYYCMPEASNELKLLIQICEQFDTFTDRIRTSSNEMLQNWTSGNERDKVVRNFSKFEEDSVEYKRLITESKDALEKAIANMSRIM